MERQTRILIYLFDYILGDYSFIMICDKNKTDIRGSSDVTLKYLSLSNPDALLLEKEGGIYGIFAFRYRL
jgi:hypothetical protein